jgi:hypothetical protein
MDAGTAKVALEEVRHIEAALDGIQRDVREIAACMDRMIVSTRHALRQFTSFPGELPKDLSFGRR